MIFKSSKKFKQPTYILLNATKKIYRTICSYRHKYIFKGRSKVKKNTQYNMKLKSFTQMHILLNFQNCALYYCVTNEIDTAICFLSTCYKKSESQWVYFLSCCTILTQLGFCWVKLKQHPCWHYEKNNNMIWNDRGSYKYSTNTKRQIHEIITYVYSLKILDNIYTTH